MRRPGSINRGKRAARDAKRALRTSPGKHRLRRGGILTMELVLTLPIFGILLLGLFEFSLLFLVRGDVVQASRAGARLAALPGVQPRDVERAVQQVLPPRLRPGMRIGLQPGRKTGDVVAVVVAVPMQQASPDLLWPIGYSIRGRYLSAETRMIKE